MTIFAADVVAAVTGHMNGDHPEDNLLIAKAFGYPDAAASTMTGVTGEAGIWRVTDAAGAEHEVAVTWPGGPISERPEIRREVVALYNAACEALGIEPRQEHAPAEGRGAHGHHGTSADSAEEAEGAEKPFSRLIREGSWSDHADSEGETFMEDIMRGKATLQDYTDLVIQHYFMYEALDEATARVADAPAFEGFHVAALDRMAAIEADLVHLMGDDWRERISPVPATEAYAARIREAGEQAWVAGVVAHHYTRYLGDLSGGQMIAKRVSRQHGFDRDGVAFYDFAELGSLTDFKERYRELLDRLGDSLSAEEQARMLDEVRVAYGFNTAVFVDLGRAKTAANA